MPSNTTTMAAAFLLTAGLCLPALAQEGMSEQPAESSEPAADLPDGFEVVERHVEAIGGQEAGMELKGVRMSGGLAMPAMGMNGEITISAAPPAKQLVEITITGFGSMVQGTNGEKAWASQPGSEPQVLPDAQAQGMIEGADFYARYQPRERYETATTTGTETIEGEEYYVVELVTEDGNESVGLYNVETGLQRAEKTRAVPGAPDFANSVTFLDYKEFDGMMFPTKMVMDQQGMQQELTFETIDVNPEFEEGTFAVPGEV